MGLKVKKTKKDVQMDRLKETLVNILVANKSLMRFHKTLTNDEKALKVINKSIKQTDRAIEIIWSVKHIEILESLYNTLLSGKENYFVLFATLITRKNTIIKWDKTDKGFQEFLKLEEQAKAKSKEEYEKRLKQQEIIKKAQEDGKKIEMVYVNGKLEPHIVEEKAN